MMFLLMSILLIIFVFLLLLYRESFIISFVIITLVAMPPEVFPDLRPYIHALDTLLLGYLFFKEYGLDFKKYPSVPRSVVLLLILLFSSMLLSMVFSRYPEAGIQVILRSFAFFILVYLFYGIITTEREIKVVITTIIIAGVLLAGSVIVDFLMHGNDISYLVQRIRETNYGLNSNKNITGAYTIIIMPFIIMAFFNSPSGWKKILLWSAGIIVSLSVILLASRAALAGIFLGAVIILFFMNKKAFIVLFSVITVVIIAYSLLPDNLSLDYALRLNEGLSGHDKFWELGVDMFKKNPIFGIGTGAYTVEEFNYIPVMLNSYIGESMVEINNLTMTNGSNNSHNFFLVMASDMGISGIITAVAFFIVIFRITYQTFKKYKFRTEIIYLLIPIVSVEICLTLRCFVESNGIFGFGDLKSDLPFWLLFGIVISYFTDRYKILARNQVEIKG